MDEKGKNKLINNMADNLVILRMKLKLTQIELADIIGSSRQTLMAIENNHRRMTWGTFLSLLLVFMKNKETEALLRVLEIYTDELDEYLTINPTKLEQV